MSITDQILNNMQKLRHRLAFIDMLKRHREKLAVPFNKVEDIEVNVIEINGVEYSEIMRFPLDENTYVYLSNLENPKDYFIHKLIIEDGEEFIEGLDDMEEFDKVQRYVAQEVLKGNLSNLTSC